MNHSKIRILRWASCFLISAAFLLTAVPGAMAATKTPKPKVRVMIDPGHGGQDDGAVQNGVKEKDITLRVALDLKRLLDGDGNFQAFITRDHDVYIPLDDRSQMARDRKADVFVSIHANSSTSTHARGTEIYFENQIPTDEEDMLLANRENTAWAEDGVVKADANATTKDDLKSIMTDLAHNEHMVLSQRLSQILLKSFKRDFNIKTRAIRQAPFRVLEMNIPSTLIELGFITNPIEARWLSNSHDQKKMAKAIYKALKEFRGALAAMNKESGQKPAADNK